MDTQTFDLKYWSGLGFTLIVGYTISLLIWRHYFSPLASIPGPFWASVTRLWHAYHIFEGDHNTEILQLHEQHGHFVRIAPNEISVSHPDGPKLILQTLLRKGNWYRAFAIPDYRYVTPQSTLDPREKMERSRLFASGFTLSHLLRSEEHYDVNIGHLLGWLDRYAETKEPMHLDKFFSYTTYDNAGEAIFSRSFGFIEKGEDIGGNIANTRSLTRFMGIAGYYVWIQRLLVANPVITSLNLLPMGYMFNTAMETLRQRKKDPDARFDIIAHWLRTHQESPNLLSYREVEAQTATTLGAGSDTLSCALQTFVYFMIKDQDIWQRAKDEVKIAMKEGRCLDRVIKYDDARKLPFLETCIYESFRMFGPGPFQLSRVAPKGGITIGPQYFPAGTVVSINPQVMQQSKDCWGPDAKVFRPERWLPDGIHTKYNHWLVFGLGYNRCPGEHLAEIEIFKICATIVRDYKIRQVNPQESWKWKAYFTVVPHSWPVYVERG